jgi:hypothetical protein
MQVRWEPAAKSRLPSRDQRAGQFASISGDTGTSSEIPPKPKNP